MRKYRKVPYPARAELLLVNMLVRCGDKQLVLFHFHIDVTARVACKHPCNIMILESVGCGTSFNLQAACQAICVKWLPDTKMFCSEQTHTKRYIPYSITRYQVLTWNVDKEHIRVVQFTDFHGTSGR